MLKPIRTASRRTGVGTNGSERRRLASWIDRFVEYASDETESCELYRRWSAITTLAACLEQKIWIQSPGTLYPNLYTILVGPPAAGKSQTIGIARTLLESLEEFHFAPTSVTGASLVDALMESERKDVKWIGTPHAKVYHTMTVMPDDLQVLLPSYDLELIARLTTFYDVVHPYKEQKRTGDLRREIKRPQLSILGGTTPSHLFDFVPEEAWSQGFTSRIILVYSGEVPKKRVRFNAVDLRQPHDLIHDLQIINTLNGEFHVDETAYKAFEAWINAGEPPVPTHKRLEHYLGRRYPHLLKLSMVSAIDRGNALVITVDDFNRALSWLIEVEHEMPKVFQEGPKSVDSKMMDEVIFAMKQWDITGEKGVTDSKLKHFLLQRVSLLTFPHYLAHMEDAKLIHRMGYDRVTQEVRWTWKGG
jgi:hypothetical protein